MNTLTPTPAQHPAQPQSSSQAERGARTEPALLPPVDVIEDAQGITLYADLPGVPRELLSLQVDGDQLLVEAQMRLDLPQGLSPSHAEVSLQRYRRAFTLSKELDAQQISAELSQGVLRVRIPKAAHAQPRRIQVQLG